MSAMTLLWSVVVRSTFLLSLVFHKFWLQVSDPTSHLLFSQVEFVARPIRKTFAPEVQS